MKPGQQTDGIKNKTNGSGEAATIDQVRDLLFGGAQRSLESRLDDLDRALEAKLKDMKTEFAEQITQLQNQLAVAERDMDKKRISSIQEIGAAINKLGATISNIASSSAER